MVIAPFGGWGALRAEIRMTMNLLGYPMSVTQPYITIIVTHFIQVVYSFAIISSD